MKGISNRHKQVVAPRERSDKFAVKSKKYSRQSIPKDLIRKKDKP